LERTPSRSLSPPFQGRRKGEGPTYKGIDGRGRATSKGRKGRGATSKWDGRAGRDERGDKKGRRGEEIPQVK